MTAPLQPGPTPKYVQVRERIVSVAVPGQAIPSERELAATFGVARATVRQAIDSLVADGLLEKIQGVGTFAVAARIESRLHLASFTDDMRRRGMEPSTRVVRAERVVPPPGARAALELPAHAQTWHLVRLRLANGQPMAHEEGWYPVWAAPDLTTWDLTGSLYQVLADRYGHPVNRAEQVLWGEAADTAMARLLEVHTHCPLLVFQRTSWSDTRPIEHVVSRYRGDRYQVHMTLSDDMATTH